MHHRLTDELLRHNNVTVIVTAEAHAVQGNTARIACRI